jgi:hypothetical protein
MAAISQIPIELLFYVFSYLDLKSLIAAHAVCRRWRGLVPTSNIAPSRRALFELYLQIVSSPYFPQTRPWLLKRLKHFDREAYLATLLDQHNYLPEDFCLWILEWPACAAFGRIWPGLHCIEITEVMKDGVRRIEGVNWLGSVPPQVSAMTWLHSGRLIPVPGLLIWGSCNGYTWLVLDERKELREKVVELESVSFIRTADGDDVDMVHKSWIDFLKELWRDIEGAASDEASKPIKNNDSPWHGIRSGRRLRFPAKRWVRKREQASLE